MVSSQETEFLFINKDDFADVLQKEIQTDLERKIQFLNTLPFFKGMQKENVHQLASTGRIREYHQNEVILTEGEFSPHIIVIW